MIKALITQSMLHEETLQQFQQMDGYQFFITKDLNTLSSQDKAEIEVVLGTPTKEMIEQLPNLKLVQLFSAGVNHVLWLPHSIHIANAYGSYGPGIGEFMLASTLAFQKDFQYYGDLQRQHKWQRDGKVFVMKDAKILSVGMGSIGTEYLRLCHLLGAKCYGVRRTIHDKPDFVEQLYTMEQLDDILPEFDVVALSLPETQQTIGLFDKSKLSKMRKDSILINVGRGSAIVSDDLVDLLKQDYFQGVCLDVTDPEPLPQNHELWDFKNVLITPHISGGFTVANYDNVINIVTENLKRFKDNQPLIHVVDRKVGY